MTDPLQPQFTEILTLIQAAQQKVLATTNQELIKLYWSIGKYISDRLSTSEWGQKTIKQLAAFIQTQKPGIKGFEKRHLERMCQFYETYPEITTALRTQLSWTHHRIILIPKEVLRRKLNEFYELIAYPKRSRNLGWVGCDCRVVDHSLEITDKARSNQSLERRFEIFSSTFRFTIKDVRSLF